MNSVGRTQKDASDFVKTVPMMTRLNPTQVSTLDTLVKGGLARSHSHALAWCVDRISKDHAGFLTNLESALVGVAEARRKGPK